MDRAAPGADGVAARVCLCCGAPTVSRSIPACWPHWELLPEDLQKAIVISYGRVALKLHAEKLLEAVRFWRLTGAWRPRTKKTAAPTPVSAAENSTSRPRIISLDERRQKSARVASRPLPDTGAEDRVAASGS